MSETYNLNNLELDDNIFEILPDGDYHFTVESHEVGFASSDKLPPNTQQITLCLQIPFMKDGSIKTTNVKSNLNVYKKALFAIRQFAESIGMCAESGKFSFNIDNIDGRTGICALTSREYNGNTYNNVTKFYPPSKAPIVTANDDSWGESNDEGFMEVDLNDDDPFL